MRVSVSTALVGSLVFISACSESGPAEEAAPLVDPQAAQVSRVASDFLSALSVADTASLSRLLAPNAMIYSVRAGEGGTSLRAVSRGDFLTSLGEEDQDLLERMWSPEVLVEGGVAMVWTPYDFHLNGEFSHCGIDVFTLLRGAEGWQVASVTYNVVRDGCTPSPLGPPERST